jgi:hypothetical protein
MKNWTLILLVFVFGCSKDEMFDPIIEPEVVVTPTSTWSDDRTIEYEIVDPMLKSTNKGKLTVPVVIINYLPTAEDGVTLDMNFASDGYYELNYSKIDRLKLKIKSDKIIDKLSIEEGSRFRDYGKDIVTQYVDINVIAYINVYKVEFTTIGGVRMIDYHKLFKKINMENYVNTQGVKEVWFTIFGKGPSPSIKGTKYEDPSTYYSIPETNMSSKYGDVSNSSRITSDLPIYNNTYVVYGFEGTRGVGTDLHNRGHQIEIQMDKIDDSQKIRFGPSLYRPMFLWKEFIGWDPIIDRPLGRVGCTHMPPNTQVDYDYTNKTLVRSDIKTWKPGGGTLEEVNTDTWTNVKYKFNMKGYGIIGDVDYDKESHTKWMIFWFQSIPGENNNIRYDNRTLSNWWDILYKWDEVMINQKKLYN